jgi:UDP-N-acetylmuramoyl-tripeptide--D-alanyl-D-alanine ligase
LMTGLSQRPISISSRERDMHFTLEQIAQILNVPLTGDGSLIPSGISTDSRSLKRNMLFFALEGEHDNGHNYLTDVFQNGACGAVVDRNWQILDDKQKHQSIIRVESPLKALQTVAAAYREQYQFPVIAVTGSNGKTSTKEMVARVLGKQYRVTKSPGNLNNHIGLALSIYQWQTSDDMAVLEMGTNHFGEIHRLCEIARPTHGIITNIGKGHLEFFHDLEGVFRAKTELLDFLDSDSTVFLNGDDPFLQRIKNKKKQIVTYGLSDGCTVHPIEWGMDALACPWMKIDKEQIQLTVPGKCQLYNGLAALAVGQAFQIPSDQIREALSSFKPVDKRMEKFKIDGIVIINDSYNANPTSVEQGIITLSSIQTLKRRLVCLGDMLELGAMSKMEHEKIGEIVVKHQLDALFCYGSETLATIEKAKKLGLKSAHHFDSKSELNVFLYSYLQEGDGLMVKGSRGMKMEEVVQSLLVHYQEA